MCFHSVLIVVCPHIVRADHLVSRRLTGRIHSRSHPLVGSRTLAETRWSVESFCTAATRLVRRLSHSILSKVFLWYIAKGCAVIARCLAWPG